MSLDFLEEFYRHTICNCEAFCEGFADIADILSTASLSTSTSSRPMNNFIIAETIDKLTLFNSDFAVWLVPEVIQGEAVTRGYIALYHASRGYTPELAFQASGKYNQSALILEALHLYLQDIQDTEDSLRSFYL
ncbi:hypothetical protein [Chlamydia gallinacea]|uniref:Uncharacterized protein n=2 Tax=Chlamydia gallinacea TaxID=1457153 RepID=A0A173DYZ0_9CHLA|nr:hypothetical protein [Chlamydia gallinacea]EYE60550.1 hypothetical protein M127_5382 [Bacteroides fragilis str. S6L5]ANG66142.1 hypothetical protein M787_002270 [Chlamydia gallinacea 08-1274/3]AQT77936.1 hypothetical protein B1F83_03360 [Chlamydia gallinacea]MBX6680660.1 hypothetical protein [Chlamydia gallinacea]MBX6687938.1 hypothetical protein [Chlamydia gallinacea]